MIAHALATFPKPLTPDPNTRPVRQRDIYQYPAMQCARTNISSPNYLSQLADRDPIPNLNNLELWGKIQLGLEAGNNLRLP